VARHIAVVLWHDTSQSAIVFLAGRVSDTLVSEARLDHANASRSDVMGSEATAGAKNTDMFAIKVGNMPSLDPGRKVFMFDSLHATLESGTVRNWTKTPGGNAGVVVDFCGGVRTVDCEDADVRLRLLCFIGVPCTNKFVQMWVQGNHFTPIGEGYVRAPRAARARAGRRGNDWPSGRVFVRMDRGVSPLFLYMDVDISDLQNTRQATLFCPKHQASQSQNTTHPPPADSTTCPRTC
jgi:hypothetical protein